MRVYNRSGKTLHIPNYGKRAPGEFWELPEWMAEKYLKNHQFGPETGRPNKPPVREVPVMKSEVKEGDDA